MIRRLLKLPGSESFTELETQPDNPFTTLQLIEQTKVLLLTTHYDLLFTCTYTATLSYVFKCWRGESLLSMLSSNGLFSAPTVSKPIAIIPERSPHVLIITSAGSVVKWDYMQNAVVYKIAGDIGISLAHYFRDILLLAGNVLKGYKISCSEGDEDDVIIPLGDIPCTMSGVLLCIITLEDCVFCVCNRGIEKYRLEEGDSEDSIQHCTRVEVHPITAAIHFNQYILTGHDCGEVIMWNEVPGIVRRVTNTSLRYPVQCILSLNEDYFAISVGMSVFVIYKYTMDQVYAQCMLAHRDPITSLQLVGMYLVSFCKGGLTRLWLMPALRKSVRSRTKSEVKSISLVGEMLSPAMTSITSTNGNSILLYGGPEGLIVWRHTRNTLIAAFTKLRDQNVAPDTADIEYTSIESCKSFKTCTLNSHYNQTE